MEGCAQQLFFLKALLQTYAVSTGLKVNFSKSMMVPINIEDSKFDLLAQTFGCSKGTLPLTYLGLALGLAKPKVQDILPLISKCERRLVSTSSFLSQAGGLQMTNAVLSSLPTFFMCIFKLHKKVIKQIDKYHKHCLLRGSDINARTRPKATWELVCLPKSEGGIGVINLETHNAALLLKNLHKIFNKEDISWVHLVWDNYYRQGKLPNHTFKGSFWWRDNLKLLDQYKGIGTVIVNRGDTCYLWLDLWNIVLPHLDFPELFFFAKRTHITIQQAKTTQDISSLFNLSVSVEAYDQLLQLAQLLEVIHLSDQDDIWVYIWGSPYFSAAKAYKQLIGSRPIHPSFKWLWKSALQHKHKVFFWLLLQDRLSTRGILHRKNMVLPSYAYVLCPPRLRGKLGSLVFEMPLCSILLGSVQFDNSCRQPFPGVYFFQRPAQHPLLHGCNNHHVMVHLDGEKQSHFSGSTTSTSLCQT
jgi:hypothetical protein